VVVVVVVVVVIRLKNSADKINAHFQTAALCDAFFSLHTAMCSF
jgi:hypothetical protein